MQGFDTFTVLLLPRMSDCGDCVVCLDGPADHLLQPCNHVAVCGICAAKLETCPICRGMVDHYCKVFFAGVKRLLTAAAAASAAASHTGTVVSALGPTAPMSASKSRKCIVGIESWLSELGRQHRGDEKGSFVVPVTGFNATTLYREDDEDSLVALLAPLSSRH